MLDFEVMYVGPLLLIFLITQISLRAKSVAIFFRSLFFLYFISVMAVTLFPIPTEGVQDFIDAGVELKNNFVPFVSIGDIILTQPAWNIIRQLAGNMILLMPLGFFLPFMVKEEFNWQKILILGFLLSFAIESAQFGISHIIGYTYKIADVDDLILNTVGAVIGFGCYKVFKWGIKK